MRVLVFGASITQGFSDSMGGWVDRFKQSEMKKHTDKKQHLTIFNLGISGDTSSNLLDRIENEIVARQWPDEELSVIVCVGTNDSLLEVNNERTAIADYEANMQKIAGIMKRYCKHAIFIELPPCDETRTTPVSWGDYNYLNDRLQSYNKAIQKVAQTEGLDLVSIFDKFKNRLDSGEDLLFDGLHPNDTGHELILETIKPKLLEILV